MITVAELRRAKILESLPDEEVERIAALGHRRELAAGGLLFREGERATHFHIVLSGRLETTREVGGEQVLLISHDAGGFLGAMALLTGTPYRGTTTAVEDTVLFELDGEELRRLAFSHPALMRAFLPAIQAVSGTITGVERDREKLLAVGRLAAGLAHELNNPAAAAARDVAILREQERTRQSAFREFAATGATAQRLADLGKLGVEAADGARPGERLDPLDAVDREEAFTDLLDAHGVDEAPELAAALTEAGMGEEWVERVAAVAGEDGLAAGLRFVAACAGTRVVLAELEDATTRIATLVDAVRRYSYLDQAPRQAVDIAAGLETTLTLLAHKLRENGTEIARDLDPDLPQVEASGSELNQVWTNLIDNAADAAGPGGRITLRTRRVGDRVSVEIGDNGPGIPDDVRERVFDAFFTTKPVGSGTGLGLDIVRRIVARHRGEVRVESRPGDTRFQVLLPLG